MTLDPVKGYANLARDIAIAVALMFCVGVVFMGGRAVGKGQATKQIAAKNNALMSASVSLDAAAKALKAVNDEAARRIASDVASKRAADQAAIAARAAQHQAEARLADFQKREAAARKRPNCAALLDTDLAQVCGL